MPFGVAASNTLDQIILQGLDVASSTAQHDSGYKTRADDGREYTYGFLSSNMTAASIAAYPAFFMGGIDDWIVTTTYSGNRGAGLAGAFCMILAAGNNYVWIQTAGRVPCAAMSTNYTASQALTVQETGEFSDIAVTASTTHTITQAQDAMSQVVAVGLEAGSGNLADIMLAHNA